METSLLACYLPHDFTQWAFKNADLLFPLREHVFTVCLQWARLVLMLLGI